MAWIELHQSLPGHRKTMRLRRALKIGQAQAIGHLCMLWLWCLDNCPDGDLSELLDCEIAEAAGFDGKRPEDFTAALRDSGFLEENNLVHDWYSYAGKLIEKRKQDAERKRTSRTQPTYRGADVQRMSIGHPSDVRRMSSVTVPNPTVPNQTKPINGSCSGDAPDWNPFGAVPETPPDTVESYLSANLPPLTRGNIEELTAIEDAGMQPDAIRYAVDQAAAQGKRTWAYVKGILRRWEQAGIFTAGAARAAEEQRTQNAQSVRSRAPNQPALSKAEQFMEMARRYEEAGE